ncbi:uncharacterized protein LOC101710235 isoform X3 [Heterocephalus glaber]|uniref:Uncharacterized protein LOC101710235 isoform X3 n=1 Tax=Heterocephalus glaber TaxID=10181 RepID=A0AAX6TGP7_HETGA|nr:uncharacterized protein LOC101710235 isoform X3 [Heterocephalus glaber]
MGPGHHRTPCSGNIAERSPRVMACQRLPDSVPGPDAGCSMIKFAQETTLNPATLLPDSDSYACPSMTVWTLTTSTTNRPDLTDETFFTNGNSFMEDGVRTDLYGPGHQFHVSGVCTGKLQGETKERR